MARYPVKGTQFKWTISSVLTLVAQVTSVRIAGTNESIDVTDLSDSRKRKIPNIPDNGQVTLDLTFDPAHATHVAVKADFHAATPRVAQIIWSDAALTQENFTAFITNWQRGGSVGEKLAASVTLEIDGDVT